MCPARLADLRVVPDWYVQDSAGVRFDWGPTGATRLQTPSCACMVVIDVLSFTTSVSVAVERGTKVYPHPWRDDSAQRLGREVDAVVAVPRPQVTEDHPWSLSPHGLRHAPSPPRMVLPSPNGSTISAAAAAAGSMVIAACLRNARAVGGWLAEAGFGSSVDRGVVVIAAGERWPDGTLRPALEDLLGAGAVIAALASYAGQPSLSPEAEAARLVYEGAGDIPAFLAASASGRELAVAGYPEDVAAAAEVDASSAVPILIDGAFTAAQIAPRGD